MKRTKLYELSSQGFDRFLEIHAEWANSNWYQFRKRFMLYLEIQKLK